MGADAGRVIVREYFKYLGTDGENFNDFYREWCDLPQRDRFALIRMVHDARKAGRNGWSAS